MRILQLDQLTHEPWLNLFAATYEHDGRQGRWLFASRKAEPYRGGGGDAVVMVPVLHVSGEPARLVMVRELRVPVGGYSYALPAGLIEAGETVEDTVRREMREETGLEVTRFKRLTPPLYSSSGMTDETAVMAFVDVQFSPQGKPALDEGEDITLLLLDHPDVCRLCDAPDLPMDAKAWTVLYLYQQLGQIL